MKSTKVSIRITIIILAFCLFGGLVTLSACKNRQPAVPTAIPTLTPSPLPVNDEYLKIFDAVWNTVNETFYDLEFGGVDWEAVHEEYEPMVMAAADDEALYDLLNQMLWELNVSHVGVGLADVWPSVEPVAWETGEIGIDVRLLDGQAVITRVEADSPAEVAGLKTGFVIQSIDESSVEQLLTEMDGPLSPPHTEAGRTDILTRHLLSKIYGDPGTCVTLAYLDEKDKLHEDCIERMQRPREGYMGDVMPPAYLEFESHLLKYGIGYIRFNTFHPDLIPDMVEAVAELQDAPGIIIDLRGNPGGDPITTEELAAQFLDGEVSFGSFTFRDGSIPRSVIGKNNYTGPLVVLIDNLSFSASEYFSSSMQMAGRAMIIGEHSPGGLTAMNIEGLPNEALLGYPVAQLVSSDGRVLEGVGVTPDVTVTLERDQLLEGIDAQLQAAIEYITEMLIEESSSTSRNLLVASSPGLPPVIDGTITPGEWDGAKRVLFADGSELLLLQRGEYLYLGIRAENPEMIVANVFIERKDQIAILHASAALGTAVYQKGSDTWQQVQDFSWFCRKTDNSEAALAERAAFLQTEGWVASNSRMGAPNELEYQIEVEESALRLAVILQRANVPAEKIPWPPDLDGDWFKPTVGGLPSSMDFSPELWGLLTFSAAEG